MRFKLRQAMGTRSFYLFLVIMVICGDGDHFILTYIDPFDPDGHRPWDFSHHGRSYAGLVRIAQLAQPAVRHGACGIIKRFTTMHHLGGGLWAYGGGLSYDLTGSYRTA